jgi:hypothetical protein
MRLRVWPRRVQPIAFGKHDLAILYQDKHCDGNIITS